MTFVPHYSKLKAKLFDLKTKFFSFCVLTKKKPVLKLLSLKRVRRKLITKCGHSKIFSGSNMYWTATVNKYSKAACVQYVSYNLCCYLVLALERINKVHNLNNLVNVEMLLQALTARRMFFLIFKIICQKHRLRSRTSNVSF